MKIIEMKGNLGGFTLLKGKTQDGTCAECAVVHPPENPHNLQSMHYQMHFREKHGRWPSWHDAMRHCTPEMRERWLKALQEHGVKVGTDNTVTNRGLVEGMIAGGARALSVRQPWAWLIVRGYKLFENRDWKPTNPARKWLEGCISRHDLGVPILIHAAQGMTADEYDEAFDVAKSNHITLPPMEAMERGGLVGAARAVKWHNERQPMAFSYGSGIALASPKAFELMPCKGALGFFTPKLEVLK